MCRTWVKTALLLLSIQSNCRANPEVTLTQGTVQGTNLISNHGRNISAFLGIPYAEPPVGELRFSNPLPAKPWSGTYVATADGFPCPQFPRDGPSDLVGDEDCLYLNVYTPQVKMRAVKQKCSANREKLPNSTTTTLMSVMVWVHGGGFKDGSADSKTVGPEYLLDHDIVHVAMNYRLGLLGFFSTGDASAPGNFGLKDQVLALKWVQDNIRSFGGDPEKVTIFGCSAGGASVHYLTLSDSTQGLFHQYILQSGYANALWAYKERSSYTVDALALGERFDCPNNTTAMVVDCLRELNSSTIVTPDPLDFPIQFSLWGPTDEETETDGAFLTDSPWNLLAQGKIRDVPWIVGNTREEGLIFSGYLYSDPAAFELLLNDLDSYLPERLYYKDRLDNPDAITAAIKSFYFNDLDGDRNELLKNLTNLLGDALFVFPAMDLLDKHLIHAKQPAYLYSFEYRGAMSYSYDFTGGSNDDVGVSHADETIYLFPKENSQFATLNASMSETDMVMVDQMTELWASFAISGVPKMSSWDNPSFWEPYAFNKKHLQIGNNSDETLFLQSELFTERMQFWRELSGSSAANSFASSYVFIISSVTYIMLHAF